MYVYGIIAIGVSHWKKVLVKQVYTGFDIFWKDEMFVSGLFNDAFSMA